LPSGNADLAPTILHVLGVNPPKSVDGAPNAMDGRMLTEAFPESPAQFPPIEVHTLEATRAIGKTTWHQYLRVTEFAGAAYFDEGNGQAIAK
jgi:arylsulfatase A-like enzyme